MGLPMGYLLTWVTYGSWLPGDERDWVDRHDRGPKVPFREADSAKETSAKNRMKESPVLLDPSDREVVTAAIHETCDFRNWVIHALNILPNHAHAIITANGVGPGEVLLVIKAYGSRALNQKYPDLHRKHWWADGGSKRYINDAKSLQAAIRYAETQDDEEYHGYSQS